MNLCAITNFWEIIYVEKVDFTFSPDEKKLSVHIGEAVVIAPNVWHAEHSDSISSPNVFVISFSLRRDARGALHSGIFHTSGDDSIHHFSRQFKLRTGMTPTEYQKSVIALSDEMRVKQGGMT